MHLYIEQKTIENSWCLHLEYFVLMGERCSTRELLSLFLSSHKGCWYYRCLQISHAGISPFYSWPCIKTAAKSLASYSLMIFGKSSKHMHVFQLLFIAYITQVRVWIVSSFTGFTISWIIVEAMRQLLALVLCVAMVILLEQCEATPSPIVLSKWNRFNYVSTYLSATFFFIFWM